MSKLSFNDSLKEGIVKLSEGNIGACTALMELNKYDPKNFAGYLLTIDVIELYGANLYVLWNDSCDRDAKKMAKILDYFLDGKITKEEIKKRTDGRGRRFDDILGGI